MADILITMQTITIRKPDDWHCHFRDGDMLHAVAPFTAKHFGRAIVMPNLAPHPVTTTDGIVSYRKRILEATSEYPQFTPLMTYYLTDKSDGEEIAKGYTDGVAQAVKLYPAGATTNSEQGVTDIKNVYPVLEAMQKVGMPLLIHGEKLKDDIGQRVDPYDREKLFIEQTISKLIKDFPELKIVLEHATTKEAAQFIEERQSDYLAGTVTVQHLMLSRADMFEGGLQPHYYCLPPIKRDEHREALRKVVTNGSSHFFLGTDSAPHPTHAKERATGCAAGMFTAPVALECYAQVFDEMGKLENLEAFASLNGPRFYGLEPNEETVTLKKELWTIDETVEVSNGDRIRPFGYHEEKEKRLTINWRVLP